jgi:uncharacterized RDD family membrane protein YckC
MPALTLRTPEGITLRREIAGAGSRFTAALIDTVLIGMIYTIIGLGTLLIADVDVSGLSHVVQGILIGGMPLCLALYHFAFHALGHGQTPGKRLLALRVVSADGYPATLAQNLLRSALWPVDVLLPVPVPFGLLGLVVIAVTDKRQRIGDIVAGTLVVVEPEESARPDPFPGVRWSHLERRTLDLQPGTAARFSDEDYDFLRELLARDDLEYDERRALLVSTARFYAKRLEVERFKSAPVFLKELFLFLRESREARA